MYRIKNFDYREVFFKTLQEDFGAYGEWNADEHEGHIYVDLMVDCNESIVDKPVTDKQKFVLTQLPNLVGLYDERLSNRRGAISKVITLCKLFSDVTFYLGVIKEDDRILNNPPIIYKRHSEVKNTDDSSITVEKETIIPKKAEVYTIKLTQ